MRSVRREAFYSRGFSSGRRNSTFRLQRNLYMACCLWLQFRERLWGQRFSRKKKKERDWPRHGSKRDSLTFLSPQISKRFHGEFTFFGMCWMCPSCLSRANKRARRLNWNSSQFSFVGFFFLGRIVISKLPCIRKKATFITIIFYRTIVKTNINSGREKNRRFLQFWSALSTDRTFFSVCFACNVSHAEHE